MDKVHIAATLTQFAKNSQCKALCGIWYCNTIDEFSHAETSDQNTKKKILTEA